MGKILVTGCAGFIGFHFSRRLLQEGHQVVGLDNLNDYYEVSLKIDRLNLLRIYNDFTFYKASLEDSAEVSQVFSENPITRVVNLAAQAGVQYSLQNPRSYVDSNIVGFLNLLEACRNYQVRHLVFASSSSVYGANTMMPYSVHHNVDHPVSLYAATKKANELMAHSYSHLYGLPSTGLRFFTVYGPWGRPDMSYFIFTRAILNRQPIRLYNHGESQRDFTYIDDIIEGMVRVLDYIPKSDPMWNGDQPDPATSSAPYRIYNIGNHQPVELSAMVAILEEKLGIRALIELLPPQPGDVPVTFAEVHDLMREVGFKPGTPLDKGLGDFIEWFRQYYKVS